MASKPGLLEPTGRIVEMKMTIMASHWQLAKWNDGSLVCDLHLKHEDWPTPNDIWDACGYPVLEEWVSTPACTEAVIGRSTKACNGLFLKYIGKTPITIIEIVELPEIVVQILPVNCNTGEWCLTRPVIELQAYEPLAGYQINTVQVRLGGRETTFTEKNRRFNLPLTDEKGAWLEYWADSTYGDRSELFRVKYRNVVSDDGSSFHFDLLGYEWNQKAASGAALWNLFPPVDGSLPPALVQPDSVYELRTQKSYLYLAGHLVQTGDIETSNCLDGGINLSGAATPCGERAGFSQVVDWQNRYDSSILDAALKYNIPARVLKNIIAQESQFWPTSDDPFEKGLGYLTSDGVDMLLMWNLDYFLEMCIPDFGKNACASGYSHLSDIQKALLRKRVLDKIGTNEEVDVLAAVLLASATQSGQLVQNTTRQEPSGATTYVDMWKIAVANYYTGSGCMGNAIENVVANEEPLSWKGVVPHLPEKCKLAEMYVEKIINDPWDRPIPDIVISHYLKMFE